MNLPNKLSLLRIILIPLMVAMFYMTFIPYNYIYATVIFALASFTDFLDGYIARKYNLITDVGKFLDSIADKILVISAIVVMLSQPKLFNCFGENIGNLVANSGTIIIVARELTVTLMRMLAATKGFVLAAEKIGKIKTFVTDFAILFLMLGGVFEILKYAGFILFVISVILTVWSGIYYLVKNKEVFS